MLAAPSVQVRAMVAEPYVDEWRRLSSPPAGLLIPPVGEFVAQSDFERQAGRKRTVSWTYQAPNQLLHPSSFGLGTT